MPLNKETVTVIELANKHSESYSKMSLEIQESISSLFYHE